MKRIISALTVCLIITFSSSNLAAQPARDQFEKIAATLLFLQDYYIDSVDYEKLADIAVDAMISTLDPHSVYMDAEATKASDEPMNGAFDGVGIEFAIIKDTLTVQDVIQGGPASKVGMKTGDKIIKVDTTDISQGKLTEATVRSLLRGKRGTTVNLEIVRKSSPNKLSFLVTRDRIPMESVDAVYEAAPNVVYIKLSRFSTTSAEEVYNALRSLGSKPKGVILDLRGNGGGLLNAALNISNFFLKKDQLILYTESMDIVRDEQFATGNGIYQDGPLVIMVDEYSASSSEIVAGAIQDWDRGTIVGRRTFGKGLVQRQLYYDDGAALRLTTSRYHTPSGRVIQRHYENGNSEEYYKDFYERYSRGESFIQDSIKFDESQVFKTKIKGRTVYGGGGVMPDVFVPSDTSYVSSLYSQIISRSILTDFVNGYMDTHRSQLQGKYKNWESFVADPSIDAVFDELLNYAKQHGVMVSERDLAKSSSEIKTLMKALMARNIWDNNVYYQMINCQDKDYLEALEALRAF